MVVSMLRKSKTEINQSIYNFTKLLVSITVKCLECTDIILKKREWKLNMQSS
jgi:hypothetical protein